MALNIMMGAMLLTLALVLIQLFLAENRHWALIIIVFGCALSDICCLFLGRIYRIEFLYLVADVFYIIRAWLFFMVAWFVNDLVIPKKFAFYYHPSLYCAIIQTILIGVLSSSGHFMLVRRRLWIIDFWVLYGSDSFDYYSTLSLISVITVLITIVYTSTKTSQIFRSRTVVLIVAQISYMIYLVVGHKYDHPVWISSVIISLACVLMAYYVIKYTPNTFRSWALANLSNQLSDGFILYDNKDRFIYVNDRMKRLFSESMIKEFNSKERFLEWVNDNEEIEGIKIKKIFEKDEEGNEKEIFFDVHEHPLSDGEFSLGVFYNLKNVTNTVTRIEAITEANIQLENVARMKSDFLANMSHEIRTPMNAVIGMAEMTLRENMTPAARNYVNQIKSSGQALLTIINDILDYSKIESGKMEISYADYETMSIAQDVASIISTRVGAKPVELIIDVDPTLPYRVMGDNIRVKQVITNLATNAVKYTEKGHVTLSIGYSKIDDTNIMLEVKVRDSGIGIKQDDLSKLFDSFSQVDSKRNRNVEGTGLGLAISKNLVNLMNGQIHVESEYGKGSCFSFEVPQIIMDARPSVSVKGADKLRAVILEDNDFSERALMVAINKLGVTCDTVSDIEELKEAIKEKTDFVFVCEDCYNDEITSVVKGNKDITFVIMVKSSDPKLKLLKNMIELRKPVYSLNLGAIFNHEDLYSTLEREGAFSIDFVAPKAKVLIVDDNEINLTVAAGLMEPLQMQVDTALSGVEAINKIAKKKYDIVFMDHMMPGMDGIETTRMIRRDFRNYDTVPIIALTANALEEAKSIFLTEGMNDFIAKPVEVAVIITKIKEWLPDDLIIPAENLIGGAVPMGTETGDEVMDELKKIEELDVEAASKLLGGYPLYKKVIKDYYTAIPKKTKTVNEFLEAKDYTNFKIEAHSIKSASRQIGYMELGEIAAELEKAGNEGNAEYIEANAGKMLSLYQQMHEKLDPFFKEEQSDTSSLPRISKEILEESFANMEKALDNLDMDTVEKEFEKLSGYDYRTKEKEFMAELKAGVESYDSDACLEIINKWKAIV